MDSADLHQLFADVVLRNWPGNGWGHDANEAASSPDSTIGGKIQPEK